MTSSIIFADMNDSDKSKTIECTGNYYANSMIPQGELELEKIVHSFAAKKFLNSYLLKAVSYTHLTLPTKRIV